MKGMVPIFGPKNGKTSALELRKKIITVEYKGMTLKAMPLVLTKIFMQNDGS